MAEFKISRFRYTWKGNWAGSTDYIRDDIVRYGGYTYVCIRGHTSDSNFYNDQSYTPEGATEASPAWVVMTEGTAWRGTWQGSRQYNLGDIVKYGGVLYLCAAQHISSSPFDNQIANWTVYTSLYKWNNAWQTTTRYGVGDVVRYNGIVYVCNTGHTSQDYLTDNLSSWDIVYENVQYVGSWTAGNTYRVNDLVKFGGSIYRCNTPHTTSSDSSLNFDAAYFDLEIPGYQRGDTYSSSTEYQPGDVVQYGGYLYVSLTNNYNRNPYDSIYQIEDKVEPEIDWQILSKGINFVGDWAVDTAYKTGDVVRRGGLLYVALSDTRSDGSSLDYLDSTEWEILNEGQQWRNVWTNGAEYSVKDIVAYRGSLYSCNYQHTASSENFPGDNGSGIEYWDLLIQGGEYVGMSAIGDLLSYDLNRTLAGDGSTFGPLGVPIGDDFKLLTVGSNDSLGYQSWGENARSFYVATHGVDDLTSMRGSSPFKPWRTIRYACDQADDGYSGFTTIHVSTGTFEEILPIIVPARTVVLGSELRSTIIKANEPIAALANDVAYTSAALTRISNIIQALLAGTAVSKTTGNSLNQVVLYETDGTTPLATSAQAAVDIQLLIEDIKNYLNYKVNGGGTNPTMSGTNTAVTVTGYTNTVLVLEANKEFLAAEAVAFTQNTYPSYSFDSDLCKRDIRKFIDAFKYDIIYTGNYKSIYAARYYSNAVLGSATEDMFYLRDATGVRNCTLTGLAGTVNPPLVFDLYRRPTGGAFTSLDPGWGPNDSRTWISTRSPYVQGVTNIGTACSGIKIDGALHNGGNKSMVANDYTQVLSDGIGAWVTNNGRAELVSVFTYYNLIGYFTEFGGVIRSANGNNSYGRYGAIADGVDPTETPKTASVYNLNNSIQIASVFAGDFTDEIQIVEYENSGQGFTTATGTIVGAGVNAATEFDDIRDNAITTVRLLDRNTTGAYDVGGSGYSLARNNARAHETPGGDATGITLSVNDTAVEAEYLGLRIVITSGAGTGQYGYITAYDDVNKIATVARESDDQPGWDHVIAGSPPAEQLNSSTTYSIEPRPVFSDPTFESTEYTLPATTTWSDAVYGETTQQFFNIEGAPGTGTVVEDDGLSALTIKFTITKYGQKYSVAISDAGAGYAVGDSMTILGSSIGGVTPDNDLKIYVNTVSDDSTNSVLGITINQSDSFKISNAHAASGNFVVISTGGVAALTSIDGVNYTTRSLPSSGDWVSIAAGDVNNGTALSGFATTFKIPKFVAIQNASNKAAVSLTGTSWTEKTLPSTSNWNSVAYGQNMFVAVAGDSNAGAISLDGNTWTSTTLPTAGDSTVNEWVDIAYGKNKWVAVANSNNIVAIGTYDAETEIMSWDSAIMDVIDDSSQRDWVSISYGNNRFVAISSQGDVAYSFDGSFWYPSEMPKQDGSTTMNWKKVRYGNGIFFAICDTGSAVVGGDVTTGPTTYAATSPDGRVWTGRELSSSVEYTAIAFGNPYIDAGDSTLAKATPMWIATGTNSDKLAKTSVGARALGRVELSSGIIDRIKLWDNGSGYTDQPSLTIVDPNNTSDAIFDCVLADGVVGQPSWINRGFGYRTSSTRLTVSGDGYANINSVGRFVTLSELERYPEPGSQIIFGNNGDGRYTIVTVEELGALDSPFSSSLYARIRISPELQVRDDVEHGVSLTIQERFSQCRITGHDFLDVGTGNFSETNYPELYATGQFITAPENEVYEEEGGRVFYTSTDQSGNFRCGELFAVEQATGIVTISADFFDLAGLTELRLGGVRVGGSGVIIREFSTDPLFSEDSNNIVPTQRAIRAYLSNRLSLGGSDITTSSFVAGSVGIGPARIYSALGISVVFPVRVDFEGANSQVRGSLLAQQMFFKSFKQD